MIAMELQVASLTHEAQDVLGIELRAPDGSDLPAFAAGAHVDVFLPGGLCRQYSLVNSPIERDRYVLGVGLAANSRGGSTYLHRTLRQGDTLQVGAPRALFGLEPAASEHAFIAGGIGITPIMSMIRVCESQGWPWRLLYCVRSRARAAYTWTLARQPARAQLHVDEESDGSPADLHGWLNLAPHGAHVYCCGPAPLMDAVALAAAQAGIPNGATHFERFVAVAAGEGAAAADFWVVLNRSGRKIHVTAQQSLLEALEQSDVSLPFSCREGLCRSCELPLMGGEADHRDSVLSDEERAAHNCILPCVSRARSPELVLDL